VAKPSFPSTPATRLLRSAGVLFTEHLYRYEAHGGTRIAAQALGVDEHAVVKTLVMEDDRARALIVLMHGDREVSTKQLARQAGRRAVTACHPEAVSRHTGYLVGGTSPFGTRRNLPVFVERSILRLPIIYLNGGSRGFLLAVPPGDVVRLLDATLVDVALAGSSRG
jgi:Cys-tRNA(Pro) deacylase